jgi:hypothetical protein
MDFDGQGWSLGLGVEALGKLVARYPTRFGEMVLTTNFDPLIEVAISRASGAFYKTILHADGNLAQTEATGCHIVHLHGYWYGSDTLHTVRQLGQDRPRLNASLRAVLRNKLVVVCAYGGWDDAFTGALMEAVSDLTEYPEILWTFFGKTPKLDSKLVSRLTPGLDRGRVSLYSGVDCNLLLPRLYDVWTELESGVAIVHSKSNPVRVSLKLSQEVEEKTAPAVVVEGDDEDRPPVVEICVGRDVELAMIRGTRSPLVFLTGIGGQGKSTLASQYFAESYEAHSFSFYVWRDCKEESERFENQIAAVIEKLSNGRILATDLAQQSPKTVVDIVEELIRGRSVLFVFDNVDHYVNLDTGRFVGTPDLFVAALARTSGQSRAIFTCRPSTTYPSTSALNCHLSGIALEAAVSLFEKRGAVSTGGDVRDAHELTDGHAFWLDLLAIQAGKQPLNALLAQLGKGGGPLPDAMLNSIWDILRDREQLVLRIMAETVKPETETEIGEYLRDTLTYNKLIKALRVLRSLNVVVIKRRNEATDLLELHPLVRRFVVKKFPKKERVTIIDSIINAYQRFRGSHKAELDERPSLPVLQYWTQNAELAMEAEKYSEAFRSLSEACEAFLSSAYPREFARTARKVLAVADWVTDHGKWRGVDHVISTQVRILSNLGEIEEVDRLLEKYELSVPERDARYINYADARCYSKWVRGDFTTAIRWGKIGVDLKSASGVDTQYDASHNLALAERDAGTPEKALSEFLEARPLAEVLDPDELEESRGGPTTGISDGAFT